MEWTSEPPPSPPLIVISKDTILLLDHKPKWHFRRVALASNLEEVPLATIRQFLEDIAEHVEYVSVDKFIFDVLDRTFLLGSLVSRARHLQELWLSNWDDVHASKQQHASSTAAADVLLFTLQMAPSLQKLTLGGMAFSSPEAVEQFLATTKTLQELHLDHVHGMGDLQSITGVAHAFRRGLQRNESLEALTLTWFRKTITCGDGVQHQSQFPGSEAIFREVLLGLMGNRKVRRLTISLGEPSESVSVALRSLLSGSTCSLKEVTVKGQSFCLEDVFLGLAHNDSVRRLRIGTRVRDLSAFQDSRLASAVTECFATNQTLRIMEVLDHCGTAFGPESQNALINSLARRPRNVGGVEELVVSGLTGDILPHVLKLRKVTLMCISPRTINWSRFSTQILHGGCSCLQHVNLDRNQFTSHELGVLLEGLSGIPSLQYLRMSYCGIQQNAARLFASLIRHNRLKKLDLGSNPLGTAGIETIMSAVCTSPSMSHLCLSTIDYETDVNQCSETLFQLLCHSRLVYLDIQGFVDLNVATVSLVAAGLKKNSTLKKLMLPDIKSNCVSILGGALTGNRSLAYLQCYLAEENDVDEESMLSFIQLLPQMKGLQQIAGILNIREPSDRLNEAFLVALRENTTLTTLGYKDFMRPPSDHFIQPEATQFYLTLNQFGRDKVAGSGPNGESPLPIALLPRFFARMSKPEHASHLYYFLRRKPDILCVDKK